MSIPSRKRYNLAEGTLEVDRRRLIRRISIAKLPKCILSPALDSTANRQRAGMISPGSKRHDAITDPLDSDGGRSKGDCTVAHLPMDILPPAEDAAALGQNTSVIGAGNHSADSLDLIYPNRAVLMNRCAIAQLTMDVVAPTEDLTAGRQRTGMIVPCGEGHDRLVEIHHRHWKAATNPTTIAQLPRLIAPPTLDATVE
jgi:hypothetical protein